MKSYQNFVKMLNNGMTEELIKSDDAINLLCHEMPLTFHKGSWAIKEYGGVMVNKKRLVAWYKEKDEDEIELHDIYYLLKGN